MARGGGQYRAPGEDPRAAQSSRASPLRCSPAPPSGRGRLPAVQTRRRERPRRRGVVQSGRFVWHSPRSSSPPARARGCRGTASCRCRSRRSRDFSRGSRLQLCARSSRRSSKALESERRRASHRGQPTRSSARLHRLTCVSMCWWMAGRWAACARKRTPSPRRGPSPRARTFKSAPTNTSTSMPGTSTSCTTTTSAYARSKACRSSTATATHARRISRATGRCGGCVSGSPQTPTSPYRTPRPSRRRRHPLPPPPRRRPLLLLRRSPRPRRRAHRLLPLKLAAVVRGSRAREPTTAPRPCVASATSARRLRDTSDSGPCARC